MTSHQKKKKKKIKDILNEKKIKYYLIGKVV